MALRDPRLELFARELVANIAAGMKRSAAAAKAAEDAGYPKTKSSAANARKRAQRKDVKGRMAELMAPALERAEVQTETSIEWAYTKLATIASYDLGEDAVKVPDQIAAVKLMAQLKGWLAPERLALAGADGQGPIRHEFAWKSSDTKSTTSPAGSSSPSTSARNASPA